ncbi:hypothetical protein SCHPADRAFT_269579 [Schizopora paradoxa]|uniref:DUF6533 domain-containing protein n=1 Tax=Schizopora paradoxa TaxID=27342 RepID=A0A0H2RTY0_9AGAM|nr:hypothetical protein SCHPADRAFT_269579 [Schizopora paradoxa]
MIVYLGFKFGALRLLCTFILSQVSRLSVRFHMFHFDALFLYSNLVASCTLFIYDALLKFDDEIFCIWNRPWRFGKVAYIWTKFICACFATWSIYVGTCAYRSTYMKQAILGARVYALLGKSRAFLIGSIFCFAILPNIIAGIEYPLGLKLFPSVYLLPSICGLGFVTDATLFALIIFHAIRRRASPLSFGSLLVQNISQSREDAFSAVPVWLPESRTGLFSLMISDSVKYYSFMLSMYITTVIISRVVEDSISDVSYIQLGLVTVMTVLMGVLAPRLLLSIRKEFYTIVDPPVHLSELRAQRATSMSTN